MQSSKSLSSMLIFLLFTQIHHTFALKMNKFYNPMTVSIFKLVAKETELRHKTQIAYCVLLYKWTMTLHVPYKMMCKDSLLLCISSDRSRYLSILLICCLSLVAMVTRKMKHFENFYFFIIDTLQYLIFLKLNLLFFLSLVSTIML